MRGLLAFASWFLQGGSRVFWLDVVPLLEGRAEIGLVAVTGDFRGLGDAYSIPFQGLGSTLQVRFAQIADGLSERLAKMTLQRIGDTAHHSGDGFQGQAAGVFPTP